MMVLPQSLITLPLSPIADIKAFLSNHGIRYNSNEHRLIAFIENTNRIPKLGAYDSQFCNGLVIDLHEKRYVVIPPKISWKKQRDMDAHLYDNIHHYRVSKLQDATMIHLSWSNHNNKWTLSTTKGYDMNGVSRNNITFWDAFVDALDGKVDFSRLNKLTCYSFLLSHPTLHPFQSEKKVTFIRSVHTRTGNIKYALANLPKREYVRMHYKKMQNNCRYSFSNFIKNDEKCYGYLLESKDGSYNYIMLSSLMNKIAYYFYDKSYTNESRSLLHAIKFRQDELKSLYSKLPTPIDLDDLYERCKNAAKDIPLDDYVDDGNDDRRVNYAFKHKKSALLNMIYPPVLERA